jgi:hypothetical protein
MPNTIPQQPATEIKIVADPRRRPSPAGSFEERAETAMAIGWPGAFDVTCGDIEQLLKAHLFWES